MSTESRAFHNAAQMRKSYFTQGHSLHCLTAKTKHFDAQRVLAILSVPSNITTSRQRAQ
jgi:hypothetical protein